MTYDLRFANHVGMTPAALIDALGKPPKLAERLGRKLSTVAVWKHRNAIPVEAWPAVIALAKEDRIRGVTAEGLLAMHHGAPAAPQPAGAGA